MERSNFLSSFKLVYRIFIMRKGPQNKEEVFMISNGQLVLKHCKRNFFAYSHTILKSHIHLMLKENSRVIYIYIGKNLSRQSVFLLYKHMQAFLHRSNFDVVIPYVGRCEDT